MRVAAIEALLRSAAAPRVLALLDPAERDLCLRRRWPAEGLAARLAGKRALVVLLHAREAELGITAAAPPRTTFPQVSLLPDVQGRPCLRVCAPLQARLTDAGLDAVQVSLTHTRAWGGALVIAAATEGSPKRTLL